MGVRGVPWPGWVCVRRGSGCRARCVACAGARGVARAVSRAHGLGALRTPGCTGGERTTELNWMERNGTDPNGTREPQGSRTGSVCHAHSWGVRGTHSACCARFWCTVGHDGGGKPPSTHTSEPHTGVHHFNHAPRTPGSSWPHAHPRLLLPHAHPRLLVPHAQPCPWLHLLAALGARPVMGAPHSSFWSTTLAPRRTHTWPRAPLVVHAHSWWHPHP